MTALLAGCLALTLGTPPKPVDFIAVPKSGHGPGVLVLHAWWGLNADVKALCTRLADAGFVTDAPDLFDGKTAATRAQAEALVKEYEPKAEQTGAKIERAAEALDRRTGGKGVAVLGLSFGAYYALAVSNEAPAHIRAVVDFYGTGPGDFNKSKAAYLGHFAERDEFEPKKGVDALAKALKAAGRPATLYTYPGTGHWFFEPSVKGHYDKASSDLAWSRTLRFLRATFSAKG